MKLLRRLSGLIVLAAVAAGAAVLVRRRLAGTRERVDLYYEDGSMTSLEDGSLDAERLLGFARDAVDAVHAA